jgi:ribosome biogenesis protein Nip4
MEKTLRKGTESWQKYSPWTLEKCYLNSEAEQRFFYTAIIILDGLKIRPKISPVQCSLYT